MPIWRNKLGSLSPGVTGPEAAGWGTILPEQNKLSLENKTVPMVGKGASPALTTKLPALHTCS